MVLFLILSWAKRPRYVHIGKTRAFFHYLKNSLGFLDLPRI